MINLLDVQVQKDATIAKIQSLLDKAYSIRGSLLGTSITLAEEALELSREIEDGACLSRSLSILSLCYMITGTYEKSMAYAEEAINIYEELGDEKGMADAKYNIAGIYYKTDNPNVGLIFLKECLTTYEKFEDHHNIARVYKSMGTIYEYFGDEKSAINAYEQSIEAGISAGDPNLESNAYNPLSGIYLNSGHVQLAMELIQKSIDMKSQTGDVRGLGFALYGRGKVYMVQKEYAKAENDLIKSLEIHEKAMDPLGIGMTQNKLAALYIEMDRLDDAKEIINRMLRRFDDGKKVKLIIMRSYFMLYQIAKKEGNYKEALNYLELHNNEKDSVINSRTLKVIESYDTINKLKNLENEAIAQREKAEIIQKKNLELDSFFYRISNDLKIPINSMKRLDFMIREEAENSKLLKFADEFKHQVKSIEQILDELIRISRVNHLSDIKETIDFNRLIKDAMATYQYMANFRKIKFDIEIEDGIVYNAEWALVNAVFQNLLERSILLIDVGKKQPQIKISVKTQARLIIITVLDNGKLMPPDQLDKLQDTFNMPHKHFSDTGIGLSILYRALENLKGKISFEAIASQGNLFTVTLPM